MAATINLNMRGGNSFSRNFSFLDADRQGVTVSDSKMVFTAQGGTQTIRKATDVPNSGLFFTDGFDYKITLMLTPDETGYLAGRKVTYEMEHWFNDGEFDQQVTRFEGTISTKPGVNDNVDP